MREFIRQAFDIREEYQDSSELKRLQACKLRFITVEAFRGLHLTQGRLALMNEKHAIFVDEKARKVAIPVKMLYL